MLEEPLRRHFGFESFRRGQREVMELIAKGGSAAAIFPTGAGKSLCYQLPALLLPHMTLVVSPLLALMKDQVDFLISRNIAAARPDFNLTPEAYNDILGGAKNGELKILMISVERFKNERFRHHLEKMDISLLVVDEAHCISQWGHNFRPEYLKLPAYQKEYSIPQTLLLTATAAPQVIEDMCSGFVKRFHCYPNPKKRARKTSSIRSGLGCLSETEHSDVQSQALQAQFVDAALRNAPASQFMDRARAETRPEDVGDQALMRGLDTACPFVRPGLPRSRSGRRSPE